VNPEERHRARQAALQILYQWEVGKSSIDRAIATVFDLQWPPDEAPPSEAVRDFGAALARDTVERLAAMDALIADTSERWRPERMAIIDRLILRMAACELQRDGATPPAVVINEAIELARSFSGEESVKFINGMLDGIRKKMER
jgi:N utilization substance protein B